ncbi:MAG TPA: hypothetical protein ENO23_02845, partial [Alphaproteobacteria bacterium]|nr:hypothetical protein [Alphaproteobacteria bacterium]
MGRHRTGWLRDVTAACLLGLVGASPVVAEGPAGVRIDVEIRGEGRHERLAFFVADRRVRIEQHTPGQKHSKHVLVYLGRDGRFLSLDPRARVYVEVDRELIAAAMLTTRAARREVDAQIGRLPASMHAALERLLGAREDGDAAVDEPIFVREIPGSDRSAGLDCRKRRLVRASKPIAELCVSEWSAVGLEPVDLEIFRELANFQRELMGARDLTPLELVPDQPLDLLVQFDGFP